MKNDAMYQINYIVEIVIEINSTKCNFFKILGVSNCYHNFLSDFELGSCGFLLPRIRNSFKGLSLFEGLHR